MSYLQLHHIAKSYSLGNKERVPVLHDITVGFERGEFVSILGESGSGKSTLMNIIGGMDQDYTGDVMIDGGTLRQKKEKQLDDYRKLKIGFIFQNFNLISHLSVLDNVTLTMQMTDVPRLERVAKAKQILTDLGLSEHLHKRPSQLSGGQKQRVAIARALSNDPDIILADEPTGALDKKNSTQIMHILDDIAKEGKLVIAVTHSQSVADYSTRVITMEDGKIVQEDIKKEAYPSEPEEHHAKTKSLPLLAAMKIAFRNVRLNLKRNILVSLGGAIGIFSVILMLGLGSGVTNYINNQINAQLSPDLIQVTKTAETSASAVPNPLQEVKPLTNKDIRTAENLNHVDNVEKVASINVSSSVNYQNESADIISLETLNRGVNKDDLVAGSFPKDGEILISDTIADKLMKNSKQAIGKEVNFYVRTVDSSEVPIILERKLTVSGIIKSSLSQDSAFVTYKALEDMYATQDLTLAPTQLNVTVDDVDQVPTVEKELEKKGFTGTGVSNILDQVNTYLSIATFVLAGIAGISLLVSAIMIVVVLYISVVERTKEIGILRAIGARRKDIKRIFFVEAAIIGIASGVIGVIIAALIGFFGNNIMEGMFDARVINVSFLFMLIGIAISFIISILAAVLPASKAANLDPMESLRYE
ncbi:ATP-binding cassette domain-containing protein [Listeria booriae]|uniref:ATP-binding cassette domain-containing protein n=2 Tax=Listeria TaxID=1637 RepID=A0A841YSD5_9LIST|nr:ABC transporter ATP-binding protein/permease [Listeria booriae]MBC1402728.1 ATP-binding cassette domain-containing protein [Listeria booriae]MBC1617756.1 ATP-binding cassette domain-containing protein [Listeria booriae]